MHVHGQKHSTSIPERAETSLDAQLDDSRRAIPSNVEHRHQKNDVATVSSSRKRRLRRQATRQAWLTKERKEDSHSLPELTLNPDAHARGNVRIAPGEREDMPRRGMTAANENSTGKRDQHQRTRIHSPIDGINPVVTGPRHESGIDGPGNVGSTRQKHRAPGNLGSRVVQRSWIFSNLVFI